jgi:hypothetical protein
LRPSFNWENPSFSDFKTPLQVSQTVLKGSETCMCFVNYQ